MISHMTKHLSDNSVAKYNSQSGVTLLLSIILLATISLVSFSVATTTFMEVRSSGDLLRTEPAYYSDGGIAEEAIYGFKRDVDGILTDLGYSESDLCPDDFTDYDAPASSEVEISSQVRTCNSIGASTFQLNVPRTANDFNNALRFYMVNPEDFEGGGGYGRLEVTNRSPSAGQDFLIYVCDLFGEDEYSCEPSVPETFVTSDNHSLTAPLASGETRIYDVNISESGSYEIIVIWPSDYQSSSEPRPAVLELKTATDTVGGGGLKNPKSLPYLDRTVLEIESELAGILRRVQVFIPNR